MKVFITGGSGYVGAAVVRALVSAGHEAVCLVRSDASATRVAGLGARAVRGEIDERSWLQEAAWADGLVHAAMDYTKGADGDRAALDTMLDAAKMPGSNVRALVYTSGVWVLGQTGAAPADEGASTASPAAASAWRPPHERLVLDATRPALATAVVRPGIVWGGRGGLLASLFESAKDEGAARFVGDGKNRWPLVHFDDNAALYVRVLERRAEGIFHAVDGQAPRVEDIARAASRAAGKEGKVKAVTLTDARLKMGALADALCLDQVVIAPRSKSVLDWAPSRGGFVEEATNAWKEWSA